MNTFFFQEAVVFWYFLPVVLLLISASKEDIRELRTSDFKSFGIMLLLLAREGFGLAILYENAGTLLASLGAAFLIKVIIEGAVIAASSGTKIFALGSGDVLIVGALGQVFSPVEYMTFVLLCCIGLSAKIAYKRHILKTKWFPGTAHDNSIPFVPIISIAFIGIFPISTIL